MTLYCFIRCRPAHLDRAEGKEHGQCADRTTLGTARQPMDEGLDQLLSVSPCCAFAEPPQLISSCFRTLEQEGLLDRNNDLHLHLLHLTTIPLLQESLDLWVHTWNAHKLEFRRPPSNPATAVGPRQRQARPPAQSPMGLYELSELLVRLQTDRRLTSHLLWQACKTSAAAACNCTQSLVAPTRGTLPTLPQA